MCYVRALTCDGFVNKGGNIDVPADVGDADSLVASKNFFNLFRLPNLFSAASIFFSSSFKFFFKHSTNNLNAAKEKIKQPISKPSVK